MQRFLGIIAILRIVIFVKIYMANYALVGILIASYQAHFPLPILRLHSKEVLNALGLHKLAIDIYLIHTNNVILLARTGC